MIFDLKPAKKELDRAYRCFDNMRSAKNYDDYETNWRNYLNHIEKCIEKIEVATTPIRGAFSSAMADEIKIRNSDQLLIYIKQARNADNHSIQDLSKLTPGGVGINPLIGNSLFIKKMTIDNDVIHYDGDPITITFYPSKIEVIEITNRGKKFPPPTTHIGATVSSKDPLFIAESGINFYRNFIKKIEQKLMSGTK